MNNTKSVVANVDEYIAAFPKTTQTMLKALRRTIRAAAPDAVEAISYRIPTFKQNGRYLIYFAGFRTHVGVYPVVLDDSALSVQLAPYASGKATLKFPLDRPLPLRLLTRVVRAKLRNAVQKPTPRPKEKSHGRHR